MKILIACEFSGILREEFAKLDHDAWSCDLLDTEIPGKHIKGDIRSQIIKDFDLMIAHPPCTHLATSGASHFYRKSEEQYDALNFVKYLMMMDIKKICIENPKSIISTYIRKPDQIIQPWMFGHYETKTTCLWLKNLRPLIATHDIKYKRSKILEESPSKDRWKNRSRIYKGIAEAMADQWGV